jgi:hypothetical protein
MTIAFQCSRFTAASAFMRTSRQPGSFTAAGAIQKASISVGIPPLAAVHTRNPGIRIL